MTCPSDRDQLLHLNGSAVQPRPANNEVFTVLVCPLSGTACVHDDHEPVAIECVPVGRLQEVENARDRLAEELAKFRAGRSAFITIGQETLFGTREAIQKVQWTLDHLKGKAGS